MPKFMPEPYRIKMVEPIRLTTREEREQALREAEYNMFRIRSDDVYVDTLTDSGTNAMSDAQWSAMLMGDEAYAGGRSYFRLLEAARDIFGYGYIQPVHQGRAAEKVLLPVFLHKGKFAIANLFFDTTRAHVELAGARCLEACCPEAANSQLRAPFKGNMDVGKLEQLILEKGPENIGMVVMTVTNNSAGGQPVSMQNMRETAEVCRRHRIHLNIDAARYAENAMFIKLREEGFSGVPVKDITRDFFALADSFTMSAKKDTIVNMGGLIGVKDADAPYILKVKANCISYEGFYTYGGLNGRDLEALRVGLYEGMDENWLRYRLGTMEYMGARLDEMGIPYQAPAGGHGIFLDAARFYPHIPYTEFPGQVLAVELYKECGLRACDIGSYMMGNDPDTGRQVKSLNEFTRLAIPRRVYTQSHYDMVLEGIGEVWRGRGDVRRGYRITWEPPILRHFQTSLAPIEG